MAGESLGRTKTVSRILCQGGSHYCLIPKDVMVRLGLKHGDRLIMDTDGRIGYFAKLPIEELIKSAAVLRRVREIRDAIDGIDRERAERAAVAIAAGGHGATRQ